MRKISTWKFIVILLAGAVAKAETSVPVCGEAPSFVDGKQYDLFDSSRLLEKVLVARSVEVWADANIKGAKLFARHDFKSMKGQIRCSKPAAKGSVNMKTWVPALLDLSVDKKFGDSVWQVQVLAEPHRAGLWPQKARLAPLNEGRKIMRDGTWRSLGGDSYELIWEHPDREGRMVMRVVYDVLSP